MDNSTLLVAGAIIGGLFVLVVLWKIFRLVRRVSWWMRIALLLGGLLPASGLLPGCSQITWSSVTSAVASMTAGGSR